MNLPYDEDQVSIEMIEGNCEEMYTLGLGNIIREQIYFALAKTQ